MIASLFPTGTGSIGAADVRQYLNDILDSNVLQSSTSVTDVGTVIALSSSDIDENAPRKPTNGAGTVYQLPKVSTVKEGVALVIINKASVQRNISLFAGDTISGLLQIDKTGIWRVVADPANNSWLSTFQLFANIIENFDTNETDKNFVLFPQGDGTVDWEFIGFIRISTTQNWIDNTVDLGGDKREMLPNGNYRLLAPVSRSFSLVCNKTNVIAGDNFGDDIDIHTGSVNASYECADIADGLVIRGIQMESLSAPWLDFNDTFGFFGSNSTINCKDLGTFNANNQLSIYFTENFQHGSAATLTAGLVFTGAGFTVAVTNSAAIPDQSASFDIFDFGSSTWQNIRLADMEWNAGAPNTCLSGLSSGGNLVAGGAGFVNNNNFGLATSPLSGIDGADDPWIFTGNLGNALNSSASLGAFVDDNSTTTTIGAGSGDDGNPIQVDIGVLAAAYVAERFSIATDGTITYNGINPGRVTVLFTGIADTASGTNKNYTFYVAVGGVAIPGSLGPVSLDAADPGGFQAQALVTVATGTVIELFVENNDDTTDITIAEFNVVIRS